MRISVAQNGFNSQPGFPSGPSHTHLICHLRAKGMHSTFIGAAKLPDFGQSAEDHGRL